MSQFADEENQTATVIGMTSKQIRFPDKITKRPTPHILYCQ
jgi:hypothetical protein